MMFGVKKAIAIRTSPNFSSKNFGVVFRVNRSEGGRGSGGGGVNRAIAEPSRRELALLQAVRIAFCRNRQSLCKNP